MTLHIPYYCCDSVLLGIENRNVDVKYYHIDHTFMPEVEFKRRFGGVGAPAYKQMMQKIDQRVSNLGVLN